jgi:hypothetical protein
MHAFKAALNRIEKGSPKALNTKSKPEFGFGMEIDPSLGATPGQPAELDWLTMPRQTYVRPPDYTGPDYGDSSTYASPAPIPPIGSAEFPASGASLPFSFGGPSNVVAIAGKPSPGAAPDPNNDPNADYQGGTFIQNHPGLAVAGGIAAVAAVSFIGEILKGIVLGFGATEGYKAANRL